MNKFSREQKLSNLDDHTLNFIMCKQNDQNGNLLMYKNMRLKYLRASPSQILRPIIFHWYGIEQVMHVTSDMQCSTLFIH